MRPFSRRSQSEQKCQHVLGDGMWVDRHSDITIFPGVRIVRYEGRRECAKCGAKVPVIDEWMEAPCCWGDKKIALTQSAWEILFSHLGYEAVKLYCKEHGVEIVAPETRKGA